MSKLWFPTGLLVWLTYPAVHCDPFTVNEWCLLWYFSRDSPPQDLEQRELAFLSPACRGEGVGRRHVKKKGETVISRWQSGMEKNGKEGKSTGSGHRWWKSQSPDVAFHHREGANKKHHSITEGRGARGINGARRHAGHKAQTRCFSCDHVWTK